MPDVEQITPESLAGLVNFTGMSVMHCWAKWDRTHKETQGQIRSAKAASGSSVSIADWDSDDPVLQPVLLTLVEKVGITCVPTLLYYKNGKLAFGLGGTCNSNEIRKSIERLAAP